MDTAGHLLLLFGRRLADILKITALSRHEYHRDIIIINMIMSNKIMIRPTRLIGSACRILPLSSLREKLAVQHVVVMHLD